VAAVGGGGCGGSASQHLQHHQNADLSLQRKPAGRGNNKQNRAAACQSKEPTAGTGACLCREQHLGSCSSVDPCRLVPWPLALTRLHHLLSSAGKRSCGSKHHIFNSASACRPIFMPPADGHTLSAPFGPAAPTEAPHVCTAPCLIICTTASLSNACALQHGRVSASVSGGVRVYLLIQSREAGCGCAPIYAHRQTESGLHGGPRLGVAGVEDLRSVFDAANPSLLAANKQRVLQPRAQPG
jgi:hypothetical protein